MASSTKIVRTSTKEDLKQQTVTQAVIIGDNFNHKFAPLTNTKPLLLLPLVNRPFIDYILEKLEDSDVQEVFIFCCLHNQVIRSYIRDSEWSKKERMSVSVMSSASFLSMGDIMRELDSKALIKSDFILINGAILTTYNLEEILEKHRIQRQSDKNSAVTLLYRRTSPQHRIKCAEHVVVLAVEANSNRIRYYQRTYNTSISKIPLAVFQENDEITVYYDLLDSFIAICSPCVPPLFSDNFDYQTMDDFVKGLLVNEELLGNSMYIHISEKGYGANMSNLVMYDAISKDIISRWTYPFVPDLMEFHGSKYIHLKSNVYKAKDVELARFWPNFRNSIVGEGTKIKNNVEILDSVIGKNCSIGAKVYLHSAYLCDGVSVGDNCFATTCILADNVEIGNNVTIGPGCVLGPEVKIADGIVLPPLTRLQAEEVCENDSFGEDDFEENIKSNKSMDEKLVGTSGHGYVCNIWEKDVDDNEDQTKISDVWGKQYEDNFLDLSSSNSEVLSVDEEENGASDVEGDDYEDDDISQFYREVLESLQRGFDEVVHPENIILEVNSSKHAYNISIKEVVSVLVKALLCLPFEYQANVVWPGYKTVINRFRTFLEPVLFNYIRSAETQYSCLLAIEDFMKKHEKCAKGGLYVIRLWYEEDILHELLIFRWFLNISPEHAKIKKLVEPFITWLGEAEEESSGD